MQAGMTLHIDDEIGNWRKERDTKSLTFKLKRNMFWIDPNLSSAVKYVKPQRIYSNESHESKSLLNIAGQKHKKIDLNIVDSLNSFFRSLLTNSWFLGSIFKYFFTCIAVMLLPWKEDLSLLMIFSLTQLLSLKNCCNFFFP